MKEFPPFRLDPVNRWLWRSEEERVLLTPTAFAVLQYLVDNAGTLVTQDELRQAVWPDTHVQPDVLKRHIFEIRSVLGDQPKKPVFIETLPRRGYRFIAAVRELTPPVYGGTRRAVPQHLVGRDQVLIRLRSYLQRGLEGERQIFFVAGEPGIGKTSVVDEFARESAEEIAVRISRGQCVDGFGRREAYYPMLEALSKLCRGPGGDSVIKILSKEAPTWLVQFPALVKREQREMLQREIQGATRERMLREISEALEAMTARSPMLLIFEDLQWVDRSTVDLVASWARGRAPAKLMIVGTYRPTDVAASKHPLKLVIQDLLVHGLCQEIALRPLGQDQVAKYLIEKTNNAPIPDGLAEFVHRHSEGNPLFMVAALEHMRARSFIDVQNGAWQIKVPLDELDLDVPENLRQLIEAQIELLRLEEKRVLEVASVVGAVFSPRVAAGAAGMGEEKLGNLWDGLSRRGLMVRPAALQHWPDGTVSDSYEFVHALYREVLYGRLSTTNRLKLHQQIGEKLEALYSDRPAEVAAELAHHFEESRDWPRAVRYLRLVAENAGRRFARNEATLLLQSALKLAARLPESERASIETEILRSLACSYIVSFDVRAVETCEALAARAARYGLLDVQVRALIDMAYPLSWTSSESCLKVLERALELSAQQSDPVMRARTRASCLVRRIWASGWSRQDVDECQAALAEIRRAGDMLVLATHLIEYNFIQWASSQYREARRNAIENLAILTERPEEKNSLSTASWLTQFTLPWSLMFLGEWGEMLAELRAGTLMAEKNGDSYAARTLQLYRAWLHLQARDFASVLSICESVLPFFGDAHQTPWRRLCLALTGTALVALGEPELAWDQFSMLISEMDRLTVIHDWYCRFQLEAGLTELWLEKGDLRQARAHAEQFLSLTQATAERTWQALAWEANARIALAEKDLERARDCITKGLVTMEGWEVPLAAWRLHATGAELSDYLGNDGLAEYHVQLSRATIVKLSDSLAPEEPLRETFLSSAPVCRVLERTPGQ